MSYVEQNFIESSDFLSPLPHLVISSIFLLLYSIKNPVLCFEIPFGEVRAKADCVMRPRISFTGRKSFISI